MSTFENVDIFVKDKTSLATPLVGVTVKVLLVGGTLNVYGLQKTDENGKASFILESDRRYELRFFKTNVHISNPLFIEVVPAPDTNTFDVLGEPFRPPVSSDMRLCVASGMFRRPDGSFHRNLDIHFIPKFDPIILEGSGILAERISIRTDDRGYAMTTLIRCAKYDAVIQGFEDSNRLVQVPDTLKVNLPDLLFPAVDQIVLLPFGNCSTGDIMLATNTSLELTPQVITSDARILDGPASGDVTWKSSDTAVFTVRLTQNTIILTGIAAGTAELRVTRNDTTLVRIPNLPIAGQPVTITVI